MSSRKKRARSTTGKRLNAKSAATHRTEEVQELREEGIDVVAIPLPRYLLDKTH